MGAKPSQTDLILAALKTGETLSPIDALNRFGCFRLGARVWDLRKRGYEIENVGSDDGNFARYRLKYPVPVPKLPPAFPTVERDPQRLF